MAASKIILADSHVQEAAEIYGERLPKRFCDRAPHVEERDGARYLIVEGKRPRRLDIAEGRETDADQDREFRQDESGGTDIPHRLKDMARDGVSAEVIYPNNSLALYKSHDPEYQMAVARAYNDWLMEQFGGHPDRFVPVAVKPVADIPAAVKEVERVAKLGYRSIKIPIIVNERPYNMPDYEPF